MRILLAVGVAAVVLAPALAVERWLEVDPAAPSPGDEIVVRIYEGEPFAGAATPFRESDGVSFQRIWRAGRINLDEAASDDVAARIAVSDSGTQLFVFSDPVSGRYCKALTVVGDAPADDPLRYSEVGHRLEIVPQSDPVILRTGAKLEIQVLFEREPLAGARVIALPAVAPTEGLEAAITDEIGLARLTLSQAGRWMVRVRHRPGGKSDEGSGTITATLTLDAGGRD